MRFATAALMILITACTGATGTSPAARTLTPSATSGTAPAVTGGLPAPLVLKGDPTPVPSTTVPGASTSEPPPTTTTSSSTTTSTTSTTTTTTTIPPPDTTVATADATFPITEPQPGTVAFTFDDGPFEGWTDTIIGILEEYGVTGTFFVSTYLLPENNDLIPHLVASGQSVQTQGYHHDDLTTKSEEEIRSELTTSIDLLVAAGAPRPTCLRPPYGATNATVARVANELGLSMVGWTINSLDYSYQEPNGVIETTLSSIGPGDIVLMHDQWAPVHRTALPVIIESLRDRGIGFSALCAPPSS